MKKIVFAAFVASLFVLGCSSDDSSLLNSTALEVSAEPKVCTALYPEDNGPAPKGVLQTYWKWQPGVTIRIKFLNGNAFVQGKVKKYAAEWLKHANVKFQYVGANQDADIRISFKWNGDGGSWSYVGTGCRSIAKNQPTMNFGWFDANTSDTEFSRTTIHEFGHALGLKHEQQHPTNTISWNKPVVYAYYARQGWSKADVDRNVFQKLPTAGMQYSRYDGLSIMHYSIPKEHTTNGYSVGWNTVLSATDKSFIAKMYPFQANTKSFYRYNINSQHFYTSNYNELGNKYFEQVMGRVFSTQVSNTFPIYRYYNPTTRDRLSTTNYNELKGGIAGWNYEGISGYAYKTQQPNTIPIYRYFKAAAPRDHFFTTSNTEVAGGKYGYKSEGIAFYILKN